VFLRMGRLAGSGDDPERPPLRLAPAAFPVIFRRPQDPRSPWHIRLASTLMGLVITVAGVIVILLIAALVKSVYDRLDAVDAERAAARSRAKAALQSAAPRSDGAVPLTLPKETPPATTSQRGPERR